MRRMSSTDLELFGSRIRYLRSWTLLSVESRREMRNLLGSDSLCDDILVACDVLVLVLVLVVLVGEDIIVSRRFVFDAK
jgi:hypothetical protein